MVQKGTTIKIRRTHSLKLKKKRKAEKRGEETGVKERGEEGKGK